MKWHKYSEEKPTVEGQYLTCRIRPYGVVHRVCRWSNNLYNIDKRDFFDKQSESGFWVYDSEVGCYEVNCDYWCEIEFNEV